MAERASISASSGAPTEKRLWYRSTLFNACVIGSAGFTAPGLWNAMNALGAGGAQEPFLINAANALVFGLMGFLCLFGGPIANRLGLRWTLMLGTVGYPLYSAALYTNNVYGNVWFVLVGSAINGLSAGLFWACEGAVALGYPEPTKRGKYMNIWLWFRTGGPLVGGAIVLGLNSAANAHAKGKVGSETYLIFIALQCTALPIAYFLTSPDKVQRTDGSQVKLIVQDSWQAEMKELWKVCRRREIMLLLPVFWAVYFNMYTGNFKTYYFGVRARALMGFVTYFSTLLASTIISKFLDYRGLSIRNRLKYSFFYVIVVHITAWVYCWVIQEKYTKNPPTLDWADKGFVEGFFVVLLWEFAQQSLQNFLYYFLSTMTDNISELSRLSGILRGQESFSQAVSYGLNSKKWHGGRVPLIVNTILLVLSIWPTWLVVSTHVPIEHDKETAELPQAQDEEQKRVSLSDKETFVVSEAAVSEVAASK
ncbi:Major facilitator superfamily domain general substrate transporter [Penicillium vulpinum]|uniref:Major facilitator superfamily (MFS) profile domain-containing protein n=1 Tax=Penicillium vulpinum TaxID=29845 RepID=A0A1V6SEL5_9EURO|nr:Major facilitator superfamily domain general substrate transporter [Penicillium vulpinum]KAJ5958820.1 Major facilitator superfamily domain general substrate transporter [Penicillium vulpinum]OQE12033.1 hypothetical protein PENVUL_c001G00392 [Penicillium vulpinum]